MTYQCNACSNGPCYEDIDDENHLPKKHGYSVLCPNIKKQAWTTVTIFKTNKPKPCPFCGSDQLQNKYSDGNLYFIRCRACKATGPVPDPMGERWNEREGCLTLENAHEETLQVKRRYYQQWKEYAENTKGDD